MPSRPFFDLEVILIRSSPFGWNGCFGLVCSWEAVSEAVEAGLVEYLCTRIQGLVHRTGCFKFADKLPRKSGAPSLTNQIQQSQTRV